MGDEWLQALSETPGELKSRAAQVVVACVLIGAGTCLVVVPFLVALADTYQLIPAPILLSCIVVGLGLVAWGGRQLVRFRRSAGSSPLRG